MRRPDPDAAVLLAALPRRMHEAVFAQAARTPDALALADAAGTWRFSELEAAARAGAAWLGAQGVRPGDRVLLITENCREAAALVLACSLLDAWAVLANARVSAAELCVLRARAAPVLVCAVQSSVQARGHATQLSLSVCEVAGLGAVAAGLADPATSPEPVEDDQIAVLIFTSGSSGEPKGVMLTHRNLLYMAAVSGAIRGLGASDRLLGVLPISHSVGLSVVFLGGLMHGAAVQLVPRFSPPALLQALAEEKVTVVLGAPAMLSLVLDYAAQRGMARALAPYLRIISVSGAPLELALKRAAEAFFGLPLHHGYGITECGPTIAQIRPGAERDDCSVGPLLPGVEARLEGPDGAGELFVRSPGVMRGYFRDALRTREVLDEDGWFRTGDLARLDGGELTLVGRAGDLIIRFGFNVYPAEVEAVLAGHDTVAQAAVIGWPGIPSQQIGGKEIGGEEILGFVVPRAGQEVDLSRLAEHAARHLASYKRPTRIFVVDSLPVGPTGKILKQALLAQADDLIVGKAA